MADNVTMFPTKKPESDKIWICQCGCSTFYLVADGTTECAACDRSPGEDQGGWHPPKSTEEWDGPEPVADVQGNNSEEFARARVSNLAKEPDAVALAVVRKGGTIHVWSSADTADRVAWVGERFSEAAELLSERHKVRD